MEFLKENGKASLMRLATLLIVLVALGIAIIQVVLNENHSFDYVAIGSLITLALTGKVVQKFREKQI